MDNSFPLLTSFQPISLDETNRTARLQERIDRKYVIYRDLFSAIADELAENYFVMEVNGKQILRYDTVYFDTADLLCYRSHLQSRRLRFKVRSRRYHDDGRCVFELKYKNARGRTLKERMDYPWQTHGSVDEEAKAFVTSTLLRRYRMDFASELSRALDVSFHRVTLVNPAAGHRITCDFDLSSRTVNGGETQLGGGYMILETKGGFELSPTDLLLRSYRQRPIRCSKYCLGLGSSDSRVKNNHLRPVLRRYFRPQPPSDKECYE